MQGLGALYGLVSCGEHAEKTTTGLILVGAVFKVSQTLAYL